MADDLGLTVTMVRKRRQPGPKPSRHRYAIFVFGRRATPWRAKRATAVRDAIEEGHATQEDGEALFFWAGAELVSEPSGR